MQEVSGSIPLGSTSFADNGPGDCFPQDSQAQAREVVTKKPVVGGHEF